MKRHISILNTGIVIIALFSLLLTSCGHDDKKKTPQPSGSTSLTVSPSSLSLIPGGNGSVTVTASDKWSATPNDSDVKISPTSGNKGTSTVNVTLASGATKNSYSVVFKSGSTTSTLTVNKGSGAAAGIMVNPTEVTVSYENGGKGEANIVCSGSWTINTANKPDWITKVEPTQGNGNAKVTITTTANTERVKKTYILPVTSGTNSASIIVIKEGAPNTKPTKASNLSPTGSNADRYPEFTWGESTDADGDEVKYTVQYSEDNSTWTSISPTTETMTLPPASLKANTTYYWKVVSNDGFDTVESDVVSFTTGTNKQYYDDLECVAYQEGTVANPVVIIYTGEGYTQELYKKGGQFDTEIDQAIEALFVIEPYKTYRHYFTVYKIAAYSNETGMSQGDTDWGKATTQKDTRFHCSWAGGNSTGIGCDVNRVLDVITEVPGMKGATNAATYANLTYSPTSIIINTDQYAGTNVFYRALGGVTLGGFQVMSVAQTPARHPRGSGYGDSWNTLRHEFGGHGFGLLADEYRYYNSAIPDSDKNNRESWKRLTPIGVYGNATFINDPKSCEWEQFIGRDEYVDANIGLYAGALLYAQGVWRPEQISCMEDNRPHFNTQSRWQIYRRIKITAGEEPDLEDFIANDNDKVQTFAPSASSNAKESGHMERLPYPPIMYDEFGRKYEPGKYIKY